MYGAHAVTGQCTTVGWKLLRHGTTSVVLLEKTMTEPRRGTAACVTHQARARTGTIRQAV